MGMLVLSGPVVAPLGPLTCVDLLNPAACGWTVLSCPAGGRGSESLFWAPPVGVFLPCCTAASAQGWLG